MIYSGEVRESFFHGYGHQSFGSTFYEGEWQNGFKDGYGVQVYEGGAFYLGYWAFGERQGSGYFFSPEGTSYTGEWHKGAYHGWGTEVRNGSERTGWWSNGMQYDFPQETLDYDSP